MNDIQQQLLNTAFDKNEVQFAEKIVKKLTSTDFMNTADNIKKIDINERCNPPTGVKLSKSLQEFMKEKITINEKIFLKIFWTGYSELTQSLACKLAQSYTNQICDSDNGQICGGRAVELTSSPNSFINIFGQWDDQLEYIKKFYNQQHIKTIYNQQGNPNSEEEVNSKSETLRKQIWDNISSEYAKYIPTATTTYALLVLPIKLPSDYMDKTLIKIEIPNLQCSKVSMLFFDKENVNIYRLESSSGDFKFVKCEQNNNISLHFVDFNDTVRKKLLSFFNTLIPDQVEQIITQVKFKMSGGRSKKKIKKSKKRKIKKSEKMHVRKRTRRYYKKQK